LAPRLRLTQRLVFYSLPVQAGQSIAAIAKFLAVLSGKCEVCEESLSLIRRLLLLRDLRARMFLSAVIVLQCDCQLLCLAVNQRVERLTRCTQAIVLPNRTLAFAVTLILR